MQRMGMVIGLNADKVEEYKRLHAAVWPEILAKISECNITNYSIFLKEPENLLFGYWEYTGNDFAADAALMAALGSVLGHLFPVWLKFRGGKGVATTFGVFLALAWPVGLAVCATWVLVALLGRISSLSALVSTALSPLYAWHIRDDLQLAEMCALLAALVWARHWQNIGRLIRGQEPRIGRKD